MKNRGKQAIKNLGGLERLGTRLFTGCPVEDSFTRCPVACSSYYTTIDTCTCRLDTSSLVAGVLDTHCTQSCPPSLHSRGGKSELRISSVCWFFCASTGGSLPFGGEGTGPPLPRTAMAGFWLDLGVRDWKKERSSKVSLFPASPSLYSSNCKGLGTKPLPFSL